MSLTVLLISLTKADIINYTFDACKPCTVKYPSSAVILHEQSALSALED